MYRVFIILILIVLVSSCTKNADEKIKREIVDVEFQQKYISSYDSLNIIDSTSLVVLQENPEEDLQIKQIDKICVKNNHIYVADTYLKRLIVFDMNGMALYKVGSLGSGPGEYSSIADFYVGDSCLYLYDSLKQKMLLYDKENQYLKDYDISFRGEYFVKLSNGNFLFSLAPYNNGELKGKRIAITDNEFNVINTMFDFDEHIDVNYQMLSPLVECGNKIIYYRGISNDVYIFNKIGAFERVVSWDFGKFNVPSDELDDMSKLMESSNDYSYIAATPIFINDVIMTILNKGGELYTCIYDTKSREPYLNNMINYSVRTINFPFSVTEDNIVVSYFNNDIYPEYMKDKYIPDSIKKEIESDAYIICLYHLCN